MLRAVLRRTFATRESEAMARAALNKAKCIAFDVDSTVSTEEGIDVLADALGAGEEVAAWTKKAMDGGVTFQEAIEARLNIIKPSLQSINALKAKHEFPLTKGMDKLFALLREQNKKVVLVSGGLRPMIEPVAAQVGVAEEDIFAIGLKWDDAGNYADFTRDAPTARSGGKAAVVGLLTERYGSVVMVGDGATDVEARPPATAVIGFGGNVVRAAVERDCDWFVRDTQEIIDQLLQDHEE